MPFAHIPTVLTVHDLIFKRFPQYHKPLNRWYLNLTMPLFTKQADLIIAVSEATKRDLVSFYHLDPEKIRVVYEAADPRFAPQPEDVVARVLRKYGLPERYILFVGTIEPRKNLTRFLDVYSALYKEGLTDAFVVVGKRGWLEGDFFRRLEDDSLPPVILPGFVSDEDLPAVYAGAQALVFPSLYEGFGLPMLEAMACGTPVAASRAGSLPEIGGDAAVYFAPDSVDEMVSVLVRLLSDDELAAELGRRGLERAAGFSWRKAAEETLGIYEELASRTSRTGEVA
jgi:glycosyltransferase involved in cell wall biosynthesis